MTTDIDTGTILPNGAVVILCRPDKRDPERLVLLAEEGTRAGRKNYVTWICRAGDPTSTVCGHYFGPEVVDAVDDWASREKGNWYK